MGIFSADTTKVLVRLLWRGKLPWATRVAPEQKICISIADMLRQYSLQGKLRAVWSHAPNEGKRHLKVAAVMKAMGLIPGASDYFFLWSDGSGVIEVKTKSGRLSENQNYFFQWCAAAGVKYALCRNLSEVYDTLVGWGILIEPPLEERFQQPAEEKIDGVPI